MSNLNERIQRWKGPAIWSLSSMLAAAFIVAGGAKIMMVDAMAANFARWNYPAWSMVALGVLEVANAALLLSRRYAFFGAFALAVVMLGAYATHIAHGELLHAFVPLALFALLCIVALLRVPDDLRNWWHDRPGGSWHIEGV